MIPAITAHAMIKGITISIGISSPSYDFNKYVEKRRNPTIKKNQGKATIPAIFLSFFAWGRAFSIERN